MAWRSLFFFAFVLHVAVIATSCKAISCSRPRTQASLFIFGDSILDAGNNNYINTTVAQRANFWPYGQTHFNFPTGRFCDGRLIGDFVAQYANLPLIPPFLQPGAEYYDGANFASGGAGALDETFQQDQVISLRTQLSNYMKVKDWLTRKLGSDGANSVLSNAVHLFSIGANDYFTFATANSAAPESQSRFFVGMVLGNFTRVIEVECSTFFYSLVLNYTWGKIV
uniref:Uncharacterized protein MANES_11G013800 n=1 Tax=Rhizophora mucronata TaxID=61149 RepID=A0A2P2JSU5_RHIMU